MNLPNHFARASVGKIAAALLLAALAFLSFVPLAHAVTCGAGTDIGGGQCRVFLTSSTSWTVPSDWNSSNNTIEVIGGGGGGGGGYSNDGVLSSSGGGGGGAYSKAINVTLTLGASSGYAIGSSGAGGGSNTNGGTGGDTFFCNSTSNCASINGSAVIAGAKGGSGGQSYGGNGGPGGPGGSAASGIGTTKYSGGSGGNGRDGGDTNSSGGGGGGGAAGNTANGSNGANSPGSSWGGAGGAGGATSGGSGGSAGYGWSVGTGGGAGTTWSGSYGAGGGGGGGGNVSIGSSGGNYGGGGGGGGADNENGTRNGGAGAQGIIVITYTSTDTDISFTKSTTFSKNLYVNGAVSKGSGSFVIDHPLDPKNKLLYHSFVESPDVKNIYDGTIILDTHGAAVIRLPNYFLALNKDFRYLATPIGQPMPNLHLGKEVRRSFWFFPGKIVFKISGGAPGGKVSWQITGIRHDPFIEMHPIVPEVEKGPGQLVPKGECLHPEACTN